MTKLLRKTKYSVLKFGVNENLPAEKIKLEIDKCTQ